MVDRARLYMFVVGGATLLFVVLVFLISGDHGERTPGHAGPPYERTPSQVREPPGPGENGTIHTIPFRETDLVVRVVSQEKDRPIAGALVSFKARESILVRKTDVQGSCSVTRKSILDLAAVFVHHPDYLDKVVKLNDVATTGALTIRLARGMMVYGRVTNRKKEAVPGTRVFLSGARSVDKVDVRHAAEVMTDAEGYFEFRGVPVKSELGLWVSAPGYQADPLYTVRPQAGKPSNFWLDPIVCSSIELVDEETGVVLDPSDSSEIELKFDDKRKIKQLDYYPGLSRDVRVAVFERRLGLYKVMDGGPVEAISATLNVLTPGFLPWQGTVQLYPFKLGEAVQPGVTINLEPSRGTRLCLITCRNSVGGALSGPIPVSVHLAHKTVFSLYSAFSHGQEIRCRLPVGKAHFKVGRWSWGLKQEVLIKQGQEPLPITLRAPDCGTVTIRVLDQGGHRIPLYDVANITRFGDMPLPLHRFSWKPQDDEDLTLKNWPTGSYSLVVEAPDLKKKSLSFKLKPGKNQPLEVVLER